MKVLTITVSMLLIAMLSYAQSGHVGIGTSTPHNQLDLGSGFGTTATDSNGKKLAVFNDATGGDFYGFGVSPATLQFHTGSGKTDSATMVLNKANKNVGIGTNTPNPSAKLDIQSTSQGVLVPRMTFAQRNAIGSPATGLMVYQTDSNSGFWHYDGSRWAPVRNSYGNMRTVTSSTTLNSADQTVAVNAGGLVAVTLFSPSLVPKGYQLNLINMNSGSYGVVIGIPGGVTVISQYGSLNSSSGGVGFTYTASFVSDGNNTWYATLLQ